MKLVDPIRYMKLKASGKLPSPKGVALSILQLLRQDDYRIEDLTKLIMSEPVIAGEILRCSNSPVFGHSRPNASISKAVTTLGAIRVQYLITAFAVLNNHRNGACLQFDYEKFWSKSLAAAISAQKLAQKIKVNAEEVFTAGLLSCLGELAMASIFPDQYGEIISTSEDASRTRLDMERSILGFDHRELNASLLTEWKFPDILVRAAYNAEFPDETEVQEGSRLYGLTHALHVSLTMANICVANEKKRWSILPTLYIKSARLGISHEEMNLLADEISLRWSEWGNQLQIQTHRILPFNTLMTQDSPLMNNTVGESDCWHKDKSILLVTPDTNPQNPLIKQIEETGCNLIIAPNSREAIIKASQGKPALIIIDHVAFASISKDVCEALRNNPETHASYIIATLCRDHGRQEAKEACIDDFLFLPSTTLSLSEKLRDAFRIIQLQEELNAQRKSLVLSTKEWAGANRRLTKVAMTDPLTQIPNRRYGMDIFTAEVARAKENNLPISCLVIDIDHFKKVNDQFGHKAGDAALITLAAVLQTCSRSEDLIFRYGGEEFCVVCPGVSRGIAVEIAQRIRQNTEEKLFRLANESVRLTVSIGVASLSPRHHTAEDLMHDADTALYHAKNAGRNQVISA